MTDTKPAQHTPTPWRVWPEASAVYIEAGTLSPEPGVEGSRTVAQIHRAMHGPNEAQATAEFIVRACNAHADLLAACEAVVSWLDNHAVHGACITIEPGATAPCDCGLDEQMAHIRAAIAKAREPK